MPDLSHLQQPSKEGFFHALSATMAHGLILIHMSVYSEDWKMCHVYLYGNYCLHIVLYY